MDKYEILLNQNKKTFHAQDLALLWEIDNQDTLNVTLKRFVDRGILKRIHKGFYATIEIGPNFDSNDAFTLLLLISVVFMFVLYVALSSLVKL